MRRSLPIVGKLSLNKRSQKQYQNIFFSFVYRGISILASFVIVPVCLSFLSETAYGTWLVIYSILSWTAFFDIGLGNGLKNKLSEAIARQDVPAARQIVSTNYVLLAAISLGLIAVFSVAYPFLDWTELLNADRSERHLGPLIFICFLLFLVKLILELISSILLAHQNTATVTLLGLVSGLLSLAGALVISKADIPAEYHLLALGVTISAAPVLVLLFMNIYSFAGRFKHLKPSLSDFSIANARQSFGLGGQFFVIQIAAIVIFSTDSIIIAKLFNPAQVTVYSIAYKLFSAFTIVWTIIITPYWVAFNDAFIQGDKKWIADTMRMLLKLWLALLVLLAAMLPFTGFIYKLWVGSSVEIPFELSAGMALFIAISTFANIFAYFVNGVSKIRLQLMTSIAAAATNIPLAIFFAGYLGTLGVILATCVSLAIGAVFVPIQYLKIMRGTAAGIWNK